MKHLSHIGANGGIVFKYKNTVNLGALIILFLKTKLLARAKHTVGLNASQLALFDVHTVRQMGAVQRHRNDGTFKNIIRTGDDLNVLTRTHIYLAYQKLVGVGMLFDFLDFSGNNIAHGFRQIDNAFNLKSCHNHFVAKFLHRHIYIHIIF